MRLKLLAGVCALASLAASSAPAQALGVKVIPRSFAASVDAAAPVVKAQYVVVRPNYYQPYYGRRYVTPNYGYRYYTPHFGRRYISPFGR